MGEFLTPDEPTCLRWCRIVNAENGIGFLGPTVRRLGALPEYRGLVQRGLVTCAVLRGEPSDHSGYWITPEGLDALAEPPSPIPERDKP